MGSLLRIIDLGNLGMNRWVLEEFFSTFGQQQLWLQCPWRQAAWYPGDTLMVWHLGWCNKLAGESPPILLAVWETGARPAWVWESGLGVNSKVRLCSLRRLLQQGLVRAFAEMKRVASEKKSGSSSLNAQTGWSAQISLLHLINKSACCRWTNQRKTIVHMACCSLQRSSKRKQAQDNISLFSNASVKTEKLGTIV